MSTRPSPISIDASGKITLINPPHRYKHHIPDDAMYGFAKRLAMSVGAPNAYAYVDVLTVYAGHGIHTGPGVDLIPTLYSMLIGPPEVGKSRTRDRILKVAPGIQRDRIERAAPVSANGLISLYKDNKDAHPSVLVIDEAISMLNRMNYENSSLGQAINELFNSDYLSLADKDNKKFCHVRLSILANLTAANAEEFLELFGATTRTGFYSRFVLVPGPQSWEWDDHWTAPTLSSPADSHIPDPLAPGGSNLFQAPRIPAWAWEWLAQWRKEGSGASRGRLGEIVMRVAVISGAINQDQELTEDCMRAALRFGTWQEQVRKEYAPSHAMTLDGTISTLIQDAFEAHDAKHPGEYVAFSEFTRKFNWGRKYGHSAVSRAKRAMIDDGILEREGHYNHKADRIEYKPNCRLRISHEAELEVVK